MAEAIALCYRTWRSGPTLPLFNDTNFNSILTVRLFFIQIMVFGRIRIQSFEF
jgi:hypothetical protein